MDKILLLYGSSEGQTAKIAHRIADTIHQAGLDIDVIDAHTLPDPFPLEDYRAVIIGASIHLGAYPSYIRAFAKRYRAELASMPAAFFSVSLTAASDQPADQEEMRQYFDHFMRETGWHPDMIANFAGALNYTKYGLVKRLLAQSAARRMHEPDDTSHDYELTDWEEVAHFAEAFTTMVGSGAGQPQQVKA